MDGAVGEAIATNTNTQVTNMVIMVTTAKFFVHLLVNQERSRRIHYVHYSYSSFTMVLDYVLTSSTFEKLTRSFEAIIITDKLQKNCALPVL